MKFLQILVLIFGLAAFANAQNEKRLVLLTGTVYDRVGTIILNADIQLKSANGKIYKTQMNISSGNYEIKLPAGTYDIKFGADLYNLKKPYKIKSFIVVSNFSNKLILDVALDFETFKEQKVFN